MIYGIEGQFGSGKTSTAVKIAKNYGKNALILTNIRINTVTEENWKIYGDNDLLEMFRVANAINDAERMRYTRQRPDAPFPYYDRRKFSQIVIILDEAWAVANGRAWKEWDLTLTQYTNQNRKIRADLYIVTADGDQVEYSLRRFAEQWIYAKPLLPFWPFKDFKIVRCRKKDKDGNPAMENYLGRDQNGDWVVKHRPLDWYMFWYWQPTTWHLYDDWHKNIEDPMKYNLSEYSIRNIWDYLERKLLGEQFAMMQPLIEESKNQALIIQESKKSNKK